MEDRDIEQRIEKSAENIETREFSSVWSDIKHKVDSREVLERKRFNRLIAVAASLAILIIGCSILLPIAIKRNNDKEQSYFLEQFGAVAVAETEFFETLDKEKIEHVDFSRFVRSNCCLLKTGDGITGGGAIELSDDADEPTFILSILFYADSVKNFELNSPKYDLAYESNGAVVRYRLVESYPEENWYVYELRANYNSVNYAMEYTCFVEDIEPFLNEFFK